MQQLLLSQVFEKAGAGSAHQTTAPVSPILCPCKHLCHSWLQLLTQCWPLSTSSLGQQLSEADSRLSWHPLCLRGLNSRKPDGMKLDPCICGPALVWNYTFVDVMTDRFRCQGQLFSGGMPIFQKINMLVEILIFVSIPPTCAEGKWFFCREMNIDCF